MSKINKTQDSRMLFDHKNKSTGTPKPIKGHYVNYFEIGHNAFEFVLDFSQSFHESEEIELCARIILSPGCAKELCSVLYESIDRYIEKYESDNDQ